MASPLTAARVQMKRKHEKGFGDFCSTDFYKL